MPEQALARRVSCATESQSLDASTALDALPAPMAYGALHMQCFPPQYVYLHALLSSLLYRFFLSRRVEEHNPCLTTWRLCTRSSFLVFRT